VAGWYCLILLLKGGTW